MASSDYISSLSSMNLFDLPVSVRRQNPIPIDSSSIFSSFLAAEEYAKNNPTAYVGQIITVVESNIVNTYQIIDINGTLVKLVFENNITDINSNITTIQSKINGLSSALTGISEPNDLTTVHEIKSTISKILASLKDFSSSN